MLKKLTIIFLFMICCLPASYGQKAMLERLAKKVNDAKASLFKKSAPAIKEAETAAAQTLEQRAAAGTTQAAASPAAKQLLEEEASFHKSPWNIEAQYRAAYQIRHFVPKEAFQTTFFRFEKTTAAPSKEWLVNGENIVFAGRAEVAKYAAAVKQGITNIPVKYGVVKLDIEPALELQNIEYRVYTELRQLKNYTPPSAMSHEEYKQWKRKNVQNMLESGEGIDWEGIDALPY